MSQRKHFCLQEISFCYVRCFIKLLLIQAIEILSFLSRIVVLLGAQITLQNKAYIGHLTHSIQHLISQNTAYIAHHWMHHILDITWQDTCQNTAYIICCSHLSTARSAPLKLQDRPCTTSLTLQKLALNLQKITCTFCTSLSESYNIHCSIHSAKVDTTLIQIGMKTAVVLWYILVLYVVWC